GNTCLLIWPPTTGTTIYFMQERPSCLCLFWECSGTERRDSGKNFTVISLQSYCSIAWRSTFSIAQSRRECTTRVAGMTFPIRHRLRCSPQLPSPDEDCRPRQKLPQTKHTLPG